jgi:hypothetical protein
MSAKNAALETFITVTMNLKSLVILIFYSLVIFHDLFFIYDKLCRDVFLLLITSFFTISIFIMYNLSFIQFNLSLFQSDVMEDPELHFSTGLHV